MDEIVLTGRVVDGNLQLRGRARLARELKELPNGEVVLTIRKLRATRSAAANAYYWGVVIPRLMTRIKDTKAEEIHEYVLKPMFLSKKGAAVDGNGDIVGVFVVGGSTKELNKNEFYEYCEDIRQWAAERLDLNIPDPDVDWRDKLQACDNCKAKVPADSLVLMEVPWEDGGQTGTDQIEVCATCSESIDGRRVA